MNNNKYMDSQHTHTQNKVMTLKEKIYKHVYAFYVKDTHLVTVFSSAKNHNSKSNK